MSSLQVRRTSETNQSKNYRVLYLIEEVHRYEQTTKASKRKKFNFICIARRERESIDNPSITIFLK